MVVTSLCVFNKFSLVLFIEFILVIFQHCKLFFTTTMNKNYNNKYLYISWKGVDLSFLTLIIHPNFFFFFFFKHANPSGLILTNSELQNLLDILWKQIIS